MSLRKGQRTGNNGNHGAAGKSGRKPNAYTILRRRLEQEKIEEAEKAFDFYVQVLNNTNEQVSIRMAAADRICDRVLGKPRQSIAFGDLSDDDKRKFIIQNFAPQLDRLGLGIEPAGAEDSSQAGSGTVE